MASANAVRAGSVCASGGGGGIGLHVDVDAKLSIQNGSLDD